VRAGVSPILFYDPFERVVATIHPNHTYEKVVFDPWEQTTWDVNDTVLGDPRTDADIRGYTAAYFASLSAGSPPSLWQTWHAQRQGGALGEQEQVAARKAAAHAETPTTAYLDVLGRPFLTLAHNRVVCPHHALHGTEDHFHTRVDLDIEGNERAVRDAVTEAYDADGNAVGDELGRVVMRYSYDMLGNRIHQFSMEAGARWMLNDVAGNPIRAWDSRDHIFCTEYDPLRRPLRIRVIGADPERPAEPLLTERLVYGEQHPEAERLNLRGALYLHLDQAGAAIDEEHDFKGNLLRASRRIATKYDRPINWAPADGALPQGATDRFDAGDLEAVLSSELEAHTFSSQTSYDALDRPVTLTTPRAPEMQPSVILHGYNEAGLLDRVEVVLHGATTGGGAPLRTPFVTNIDYNARGQRQRIQYGNRVSTVYEYDPLTFRLVHLSTRRSGFPDDCPRERSSEWPGCHLQSLHYTYDPAGNITFIRDDAQQAIFFKNQRVEPSADYTYDATYRLIEATGREHLGQVGGTSGPWSYAEGAVVNAAPDGRFAPTDGGVMGRYVERYVYDAVGNILKMQHRSRVAGGPSWTRQYFYREPSLLEDGAEGMSRKVSNRLSATRLGTKDHRQPERYLHDEHGNMTRMPHLGGGGAGSNMHWDYRDQLLQVDLGGGGTAYYTYDTAGERVRKVWEKPGGLVEERNYLGGFEIYRRRQGSEELVRETLHLMDDQQRIALVETRVPTTTIDDKAPGQLIRFQLGNHLGSAAVELDGSTEIISYEEYTPYGSTSYQALRNKIETPKRYRSTGKERDEESGLYYHSARYHAAWLGRWESCDPASLADGPNLYLYSHANPITFSDPNGTDASIGVPGTEPFWQGKDTRRDEHGRFWYIDEETSTTWVWESGSWISFPNDPIVIIEAKPFLERLEYAWHTGSPADKVEMVATGVGVASQAVPYAGDYIALAASVVSFGAKPSWSTAADVGLDAVGALLPVVPALGTVRRTQRLGEVGQVVHHTEKVAEATQTAKTSTKPDVFTHELFRSKTSGPKHGSSSRGYDRRSAIHQEVLERARRWWGGPGPVPTKQDLDLGHSGVPFSRLPPGETTTLKAQRAQGTGGNRSIGAAEEKAAVQDFGRKAKQLGVDPHDPSNPYYTRPTVPRRRKK
jgi:RHS repeat-associated protein